MNILNKNQNDYYANSIWVWKNKYYTMKFINSIRHFFEVRGFDVSSRLADKLGIRTTNVRLFFIYISFFTVGLSFALYLTLAFLIRLKDMIYTKRSSVFDL